MIVGYLMKPQGLQGEFKQCMCSNRGGYKRGGYKLNTVDIKALKISDLKNTSTAVMTVDTSTGDLIYRYYVTVNCSATGGDGDYSYVVYYNDAGFDYLGHTTAVDDDGAATIELSSGSGYYYVWVEAYSDNVTATQRFIFEI